ncbi:MAG: tRNA lysidine(34) synthetase TilS [Clostridiales bacterium]|nr:tRNA lysidine(34) synthetase TilS [Clostridiales bacterium]
MGCAASDGAGAAGANGAGGHELIRPLLGILRAEIEEYCALHSLCPRRDATNADSAYTRNRVRNELIPFIEAKFNPGVVGALARLAQLSGWDRDYMDEAAEAAFRGCVVAGAGDIEASRLAGAAPSHCSQPPPTGAAPPAVLPDTEPPAVPHGAELPAAPASSQPHPAALASALPPAGAGAPAGAAPPAVLPDMEPPAVPHGAGLPAAPASGQPHPAALASALPPAGAGPLPHGAGAPAGGSPLPAGGSPLPAGNPPPAGNPALRGSRRAAAEMQLLAEIGAGSRGRCVALSLAGLRAMHRAVASRVVRLAAASVRGVAQDFHLGHVGKILELADSPGAGKRLSLPGGLRVLKSYEILVFYAGAGEREGAPGEPCAPGSSNEPNASGASGVPCASIAPGASGAPGAPDPAQLIKSFRKKDFENVEQIANISYNSLVQYFDGGVLDPGKCVFRGRRSGDVFYPKNAPCAKKLKEYLIDEKVPSAVRDSLCLLADGSEIVWIVGYGISEKYKVTGGTETVLRAEFKHV